MQWRVALELWLLSISSAWLWGCSLANSSFLWQLCPRRLLLTPACLVRGFLCAVSQLWQGLTVLLWSCSSPTVSQHSGVITNHLGTSASSPNSESDNHALLDEKEDSYFSEIRNFIANSELNQAAALADKR